MNKQDLKNHFDNYRIESHPSTHNGTGHVDDSFDLIFEAVVDLIKNKKKITKLH